MQQNIAGQVIGAQLVSATDGSAFTGAVTCYVTGDGGTQAIGTVGSGAATHEGNGYHTYAPAQAETNYDQIAFTFIGTGAVPVTLQVFTNTPQTGDSFARIGANGAGLTGIPWNPSWDAEVQSEVADGLTAFNAVSTSDLPANFADLSIVSSTGQVGLNLGDILRPAGPVPELGIHEGGEGQSATANQLVCRAAATNDTIKPNMIVWVLGSDQGYWQQAEIDSVSGDTVTVAAWPDATPTGTLDYIIVGTPQASPNLLPEVSVSAFLGTLLTEATAGRIAANFVTFFENSDAATTQTVDDVGGGGAGGTDWTASERNEIRGRLGITGTTSSGGNTPTLALQSTSDSIETDTQDIQSRIGTPTDLGGGSSLAANNSDMAGSTFNSATDSNEAIRDRGDSAWLTGAGGSAPTVEQIRAEIDANSTQLAAIVDDTNELQSDWADGGRLDLILDSRATQLSVDTVDGVVDSILTAVGALNDPTAATIATTVLNSVVETQGSYSLKQAMSVCLAVLAGVTSDSGATISTPNGAATRVAATTNASNERTAMTISPSA